MRVIAIVSTKGGSGKTALAAGLAVELGAVLLDVDPQASACRWRDRREAVEPVVTAVVASRLRPALDAAAAAGVERAIVDTPPRSELATLEAARAADLVLIPCRPQLVDLETLAAAVQQVLALAGNPLAAVVLTAVPPRGRRGDQARQAASGLGFDVGPPLVHRAAWGDAGALGLTVTEYDPRGRAAAELRQLAAWVRRVLERPRGVHHAEAR